MSKALALGSRAQVLAIVNNLADKWTQWEREDSSPPVAQAGSAFAMDWGWPVGLEPDSNQLSLPGPVGVPARLTIDL